MRMFHIYLYSVFDLFPLLSITRSIAWKADHGGSFRMRKSYASRDRGQCVYSRSTITL